MDIYQMDAADLLNAYRSKKLTPMNVLDALWQRIDLLNPQLNALVTLNRQGSYAAAAVSEKRIEAGKMRPLEGIPVAIKDLTDTAGIRTTYGSLVYKDHVPQRDGLIVSRLKEQGAVIIGKTNTPEFGHKATTNNRLFGPSRNPIVPENGTGGSSGGSAAAVAAKFCPIAQGSDGGGSIRIPASLCGVFGFKPSFGRIPTDNNNSDVFADTCPFVSYGPITRSVRDAALMFDAVQGPSPDDPFSLDAVNPPVADTLTEHKETWQIGYTFDFGIYPLDSEIKEIFTNALKTLAEGGAVVNASDIRIASDLRAYVRFFNRLWMIGLAEQSVRLVEAHKNELSESLLSMIARGQGASAGEYLSMHAYRTEVWRKFQQQFHRFEILVSPTLGAAAYDYREEGPEAVNGKPIDSESDWMMTSPVNLTGEPACSLPIGRTRAGLPVGMQCIAPKLADRRLFQFAYWAEKQLHL